MQQRHLYDLDPMEFARLVIREFKSQPISVCAYFQPQSPACGQSEPGLSCFGFSRGFGCRSSWSQGLEFLAKCLSGAKALCLVARTSAIKHPPLPSWIQRHDGIIVQYEAPDFSPPSKIWFMRSSSDAQAAETFVLDLNELDLLPTVLRRLPVPVPIFGRNTNPWAGDSETPAPATVFDPPETDHEAWWQRLRTHGLVPGQNACTWLESEGHMRVG